MWFEMSVKNRKSKFFFVFLNSKILDSSHTHNLIAAITKQLKDLASCIITKSNWEIPHRLCLFRSLIAFKAFKPTDLIDYFRFTRGARQVIERSWHRVRSCEDLRDVPWIKEIRSFVALQKLIVTFYMRLHFAYAHDATIDDADAWCTKRQVLRLLKMLRYLFTSKPCLKLMCTWVWQLETDIFEVPILV